jgi:hypothetical protein
MTPASGFESRFGRASQVSRLMGDGKLFGPGELRSIVDLLQAELIGQEHLSGLLRAGASIHAYIGYEMQGQLHPGSLIGLGILRYLNGFENVQTTNP